MDKNYNALIGLILSLMFVGILVSVGVLVFTELGTASRTTVTATDEIVAWVNPGQANISLTGTNVTDGSVSVANSTGQTVDPSNYTVDLLNGALQVNSNLTCTSGMNCTVDYTWTNYATATRTATTNSARAITPVTTTWLALIVTVMVLSIIIGMVLYAFGSLGRRS